MRGTFQTFDIFRIAGAIAPQRRELIGKPDESILN